MQFEPCSLEDVFLIASPRFTDERGYFTRTFCRDTFKDKGLLCDFPQSNISYNKLKGTLRGMHFQNEPFAEGKIVRCTRGKIFDVVVDIRPASETYGKWVGFELSAENGQSLYIPPGFAHGFVVLSASADFEYKCTDYYDPSDEDSILWNDPDLNIPWPIAHPVLSTKDASANRLVDLQ